MGKAGYVTSQRKFVLPLLLAALAVTLLASVPASAAGIVAKDGKIHACYKAKGKGKGTLRVVRSAKVKCPKKWKKVAWNAAGPAGSQGGAGSPGTTGEAGGTGLSGATGTVVQQLEGKVNELLKKVESLEKVLAGVTNLELLAAIANTEALCTQVSTLTNQLNAVEGALGGLSLNAVLTTLGGALSIPTLPGALDPFNCPVQVS